MHVSREEEARKQVPVFAYPPELLGKDYSTHPLAGAGVSFMAEGEGTDQKFVAESKRTLRRAGDVLPEGFFNAIYRCGLDLVTVDVTAICCNLKRVPTDLNCLYILQYACGQSRGGLFALGAKLAPASPRGSGQTSFRRRRLVSICPLPICPSPPLRAPCRYFAPPSHSWLKCFPLPLQVCHRFRPMVRRKGPTHPRVYSNTAHQRGGASGAGTGRCPVALNAEPQIS